MSCPNCGPASAPATPVLPHEGGEATILLVGNPNVGKSTIFNHVTGARQAVINAPGTTVNVMAGRWKALGARVLDLPGTYSLVATSPDEEVVRETVSGAPGSMTDPAAGQRIDLVLAVLDGASMTRSLYLLAQIAHTGQPVAAVITMADVAESNGEPVDATTLAAALGIPTMVIDPRSSRGYALLDEMVRTAIATRPRLVGIAPDPSAPGYSASAAHEVQCDGGCAGEHPASPARRDEESSHSYSTGKSGSCACSSPQESPERDDMERALEIFSWVDGIEGTIRTHKAAPQKLSPSDKVDRFLLNPALGTLLFFGILWLLFMLAGTWVGPIQDWFDARFSSTDPGEISLANGISWALAHTGLENSWLASLLINGLATGLGVVASFFPLMFVIYAAFSVLEDSGYMARVAFLGDRLMRKLGLDGRVILPLIMGFGCNLPSLAAARTIPSARQRLVTVLITPYTSCAARLAIYLMIAKIFFPTVAGTVIWAMYVLSLILIVFGAWVLKFFITRDEAAAPLMLVLPAYQVPRLFVMAKSTWTRSWTFVTGAGKIIVLMTMAVWLMSSIPVGSEDNHSFADPELAMEDSLYGATARVLEPVFAPTGFGEWHMTGALMTGFVAKETVVSSIVTSYNMDPEAAGDAEDKGDDLGELPELLHTSLEKSAGSGYEGLAAIAFLVFVLAYTPCMATVAEQAKLIGGKLTTMAVVVQLGIAWLLATGIFQIGRFFL